MRLTVYAYPWDLARIGVESALQQIADDGIAAIDLAATYHPIDALSPRGGAAIFSDARGAVYFPARQARYGRIKPHVHSPRLSAVWPETASRADALGIDLNAWTITLFQPWIRDAYPDTARIFPTGDASGSGVCPANDDVRAFLVALCDDMVDQFGIRLIRLENIMPIFDFDWLRPRVLVGLPPQTRTLMNLCFCQSCASRAARIGLDIDRLRRTVNDAIAADIDGAGSGEERAAALAGDRELSAFAELAMRASTELVAAIGEAVRGRARISINASASYALLTGRAREAELLAEFVATADQIALIPGHAGNAEIAGLAGSAVPPREISALIPITRPTGRSGPALQASLDTPEDRADQAARMGASELSLYNFGLVRPRDISAFAADTRRNSQGRTPPAQH